MRTVGVTRRRRDEVSVAPGEPRPSAAATPLPPVRDAEGAAAAGTDEPDAAEDGVEPDVAAVGPEPKVQALSSRTARQGAHPRRRVVMAPPAHCCPARARSSGDARTGGGGWRGLLSAGSSPGRRRA